MRAQTVLLAVPSLAMAVVGLAMFGPGAVQAFDGARIRGGPVSGPQRLAWRITVLQRFRSIDSTRNIGPLTVRARDEAPLAVAQHLSPEAVARCEVNQDGICEVALDFDAPVVGPVRAVVAAERSGAVLAQGEVLNPPGWGQARGHRAKLEGSADGDFDVEVYAERGVFAAPFRDELTVIANAANGTLFGATMKVRASGADVDPASPRTAQSSSSPASDGSNPGGRDDASTETSVEVHPMLAAAHGNALRGTFGLTPRTHAVDVDIEVTAKDRKASWHGLLPVVPGAIWADPDGPRQGKLRVISPVPRNIVYATIAGAHARYWGGSIPLTTDARGFAVGEIDWPDLRMKRERGDGVPPSSLNTRIDIEEFRRQLAKAKDDSIDPMWLTVSSDPLASGAGTVGWPLSFDRDERPFADQLLLDGMPAAEKKDHERRYRARMLAAVALGAAAVIEGVLLAHGAREPGARGARAWAWTAMAIATVALAFAAIGVVVMWKTSG